MFPAWGAHGPVAFNEVEQEIGEEVDGFLRDLDRDPIESASQHPRCTLGGPGTTVSVPRRVGGILARVPRRQRPGAILAEDAWLFLTVAVDQAQSLDELGYLSAGPFEEFIAYRSAAYDEQVESRGREDPRWAYVISRARGRQVDYLLSRLMDAWPAPIADAAQQRIDVTE